MKFEIKNRYSDKVMATAAGATLKEALEKLTEGGANLHRATLDGANLYKANLDEANLDGANLDGANLYKANLYKANLYKANLYRANLDGANLHKANLYRATLDGANLHKANLDEANLDGANLDGANLHKANLDGANLHEANLDGANLDGANLYKANLYKANLYKANIEFHQFPSLRLISSIPLAELSDELTLELMRRDAFAHPHPERFKEWVKGGGCPYQNEERFWFFNEKKVLWRNGKPKMRDSDLIVAICKEKGWGISGYLKIKI